MSQDAKISVEEGKLSDAIFSEDRKYLYVLWRIWNKSLPKVMFVGLNPSTANETKNDNTITKVVKLAKNNGYGGIYMTNLFGIISADPKILQTDNDPIGSNDEWLTTIYGMCKDVVFAWGNFAEATERSKAVNHLFENPLCICQNKNGSPKHPLYCKDDSKFIRYQSHSEGDKQ